VRTRKGNERAKCTHSLESISGGTTKGTEETKQARRTHGLESVLGGTSEDMKRKKVSERGALTLWRVHREGQVRAREDRDEQVRTQKDSKRGSSTHGLESALGGQVST